MKLKKIRNGVQIKFNNEMEKKILGLFLYHADLESANAITSLGLFDNLTLSFNQRNKIKSFVNDFTTSFMQLADDGRGCPDSINLKTDVFQLYDLLPDFLVGLSFKKGIQIADLMNPFDWLLGEIN